LGKFGKVVDGGDNRKWLKTDPKPNLLTITRGRHLTLVVFSLGNSRESVTKHDGK